ncbi:MAG TPA: cytochrome c3 family protein [Vicinamibacterales bacterium]|nr:cytochrome c3 family protein [Thermoanaerobaculia bacterium]HUK36844.1 cytochrome c3 family protein [Vicinamibacterales bacterium]
MFAAVALFLAAVSPSSACTACHDDTWAYSMSTSHPVAIAYAPVAANDPQAYRQPALVEDFLVKGNVECVSCHVAHEEKTDNPFRLRTRDIVKLCTSCHVME